MLKDLVTIPYLPEIQKLPRFCENIDQVYTLVLDLDETLIHFEIDEEIDPAVEEPGYYLIRPGAMNFLTELSEYYEIVVFTAAMPDVSTFIPFYPYSLSTPTGSQTTQTANATSPTVFTVNTPPPTRTTPSKISPTLAVIFPKPSSSTTWQRISTLRHRSTASGWNPGTMIWMIRSSTYLCPF